LFKNLTIRQISFYIILAIATVNIPVVIFLFGTEVLTDNFIKVISLFLVATILSYLVVNYLLERYVFRKIKLIYKIIHKSKKAKSAETDIDIYNTTIEQVGTEVTEWAEQTEDQLSSLRALAEYRKNFVGNISHELKTPIFSMQGYLHTLLDGGIHDEKINIDYVRRAATNADRLQNIVEDLEAISNLEGDKVMLEIVKFDIKNLVEEVFQDLRLLAKKQKISLSFKEGANYNYSVLGDKEAIRQVLNNLIVNSLKYGNKGGETKVSFYKLDENILIEVSDDGIGIDDKHLPHLFDRFYRIDASRSRAAGGSGLGLSIVKHIIEAHDQTINVRSTKGVGSTFGFSLEQGK